MIAVKDVCLFCGKAVFDDYKDTELIYLVRDDEYLCNAKCERDLHKEMSG